MKIAFIHPDLGIGGAERLVLDVAVALKHQNHEVFFITNHFDKKHAFEELKNDEFSVRIIGKWLPRSILGKFQALCAYIRMIYLTLYFLLFTSKNEKPDVFFTDLIPIAIPFLKLWNQNVIYYCHHPDLLASPPGGLLKKLYRKPIDWLELKATGRADIILVNSMYTANVFRETFPQIKKPLQVLYPTIACSYLDKISSLQARPIEDIMPEITKHDSIVFLSINRFHPAKKLDLAINALEQLKMMCSSEQWERTYLILAGGYDPKSKMNARYFRELISLAHNKSLNDKVIFKKSPSDELKAELLLSCTCLIYTPINEHFGIVPLEAMAASKPVLACNSGGPKETVDHGNTGYLCDHTPESMAEYMYRISEDLERSKDMGFKGKKRLEALFSYDTFSKTLSEVILDKSLK